MSVQRADSQPDYPVTTTTTTSTTTTTTTTTTNENSSVGTSGFTPAMSARPIGEHAKTFKLDWNNPSERSKYLTETCLPEVHAAVVNDDWQTAEQILEWKDVPVLWRSASSRGSHWIGQLNSPDEHQQQSAITSMAAQIVSNTSIEGTGCVHGSNLLTLALLKGAPISFLSKLVKLIEQNDFHFLSYPDASGRTPLYIAVDRGDKDQVNILLSAGADPHIFCNFEGEGIHCVNNSKLLLWDRSSTNRISAYRHAMYPGKLEIFMLLIEKLFSNWNSKQHESERHFQISQRKFELSLQLNEWVSRNNEVAIRTLGDRFCELKNELFNAKDCTGTSVVYRQLSNNQPLDKGVEVITNLKPHDWPICKAASSQDVAHFFNDLEILLKNDYASISHLLFQIIGVFLDHNTEENIRLLVKKFPVISRSVFAILLDKMHDSKLDYEIFSPLVNATWPFLNSEQKNKLFRECAFQNGELTALILRLGDFNFDRNQEAFSHWIDRALAYGNQVTAEYLSKHLDLFSEVIKTLPEFNNQHIIGVLNKTKCMLIGILKSKDKSQFEKLIIRGLDLKKLINCDHEILPLMADCHPNNLADWISGINITVTKEMIQLANTEAGRSTLQHLIETENTN